MIRPSNNAASIDRRHLADRTHSPSLDTGQRLAAVGGILGALAASSCCILPLVFFGIGISGAWIGILPNLRPISPISSAPRSPASAPVIGLSTAPQSLPAPMTRPARDHCRTSLSKPRWQRHRSSC